jgi:hypothetical protein
MSQRNPPNEPKYVRHSRNSSSIETEESINISRDSELDICSEPEILIENYPDQR